MIIFLVVFEELLAICISGSYYNNGEIRLERNSN